MRHLGPRTLAFGLVVLGANAMATEQPKYEVVSRFDDFEVRAYGPTVVAETDVEGDQVEAANRAFSLLAGYIFGNNQGTRKIDMTAPVTQVATEGQRIAMTAPVTQVGAGERRWTVHFTMPAAFTLDSLPAPKDARVRLRGQPARRVAVVRYSGTWSRQNFEEHLAKLRLGLQREGLASRGEATWARYDPPWTLWFLRTNEVHLELAEPQAESLQPPPPPPAADERAPGSEAPP